VKPSATRPMSFNALSYLEIEAVNFAYPDRGNVVKNVSLTLAAGEIHCLIGRSGCGKTTLLKLAAGLLKPQAGRISLKGINVDKPGPDMGFVFQTPNLLTWLSVLDNVLLPLSLHDTVTASQRARGEHLLAQMGLRTLRFEKPHQLSGGQQSRVAIARALVTQPSVLFMDEPFASLDAMTRDELQNEFLTICREQGTAVLFVTHDLTEAVYLADRVSLLNEGRIHTSLEIILPRPRQSNMRFTPSFNKQCEQLRHDLDAKI
jgi:NitT/TauT family transport system ATP-binding protein